MTEEVITAGLPGADPSAHRLTAHQEQRGATVLVALIGELDLDSMAPADEVLAQVFATAPERIVVNLAGISFCDSSGLNLLLRTRLAAQEADVELRLAAEPDGQLRRLLDLTGAGAVFSLHTSLSDALVGA